MPIDTPLHRAANTVADLLLADDYASIEDHEIEALAEAIWQFLVAHGIPVPDASEISPFACGVIG